MPDNQHLWGPACAAVILRPALGVLQLSGSNHCTPPGPVATRLQLTPTPSGLLRWILHDPGLSLAAVLLRSRAWEVSFAVPPPQGVVLLQVQCILHLPPSPIPFLAVQPDPGPWGGEGGGPRVLLRQCRRLLEDLFLPLTLWCCAGGLLWAASLQKSSNQLGSLFCRGFSDPFPPCRQPRAELRPWVSPPSTRCEGFPAVSDPGSSLGTLDVRSLASCDSNLTRELLTAYSALTHPC